MTTTATKPLISYHGKPAIKRKYLARVRAHRKADDFLQGQGSYDGKGCAVACTMHKYDHALYETEIGVPIELARLEDSIFEGLSKADCKAWPVRFIAAIPVGKDLSLVWPKFAVWLLIDETDGVLQFAKGYDDCESAIKRVADLYQQKIDGQDVTRAADSAAYSAAASAADSAADSAAARAAYRAAARAADSAREKFWIRCANKLESLLKNCEAKGRMQ